MQLSLPIGTPQTLPAIRDRLVAVHGPQRDEQRHDPTTQFVKAMTSSCTRDAVSGAAFLRLQASVSSWDVLSDIDPNALAGIIGDVTYAADKAVDLVAAAHTIRESQGRLDLAFLADWPVEDAMFWLQEMRGIGPKVAAVILNFSTLRKRALAVDRHVLRVSTRLGLLPKNASFKRGYRILMRLVPNDWEADDLYELHWLIKMHGQTRCHLHHPICAGCPLAQLCAKDSAAALGRRRRKNEERAHV